MFILFIINMIVSIGRLFDIHVVLFFFLLIVICFARINLFKWKWLLTWLKISSQDFELKIVVIAWYNGITSIFILSRLTLTVIQTHLSSVHCVRENYQWAQCEDCSKWRRLPVDALLPSRWTCSNNTWDTERWYLTFSSFQMCWWELRKSLLMSL